MDHVEVYNCSQFENEYAAVRFEDVAGNNKESVLTNSAIHNGIGWGLRVRRSHNVKVENNAIFRMWNMGIILDSVKTVTVKGNLVNLIRDFPKIKAVEKFAGIAICSLDGVVACPELSVTDNIVAGALYNGYTAPMHACGQS